jgi:hypothetical protein
MFDMGSCGRDLGRAQVDRILQSETFRHSEVLRRLFAYLAEKSLGGEAERLKEYTIGVEVCGRPESYDPRKDSSVRMQAARLREKIAEYYRTEGAGDPVIVDFPKGHFSFAFCERDESPATRENSGSLPDNSRGRRGAWWLPLIGVALGAAASSLAHWGWPGQRERRGPPEQAWTPALERIWAPLLDTGRPLLISLGTPVFVHAPPIGYFRIPGTYDWEEVREMAGVAALQNAFPRSVLSPSHAFTGVGEALAAFELAKLLGTRRGDLRIVRSSALSWDDILTSNVVFVGPPKFNLHLRDIPAPHDLVLESDGIRNKRPSPGEPAFLPDDSRRAGPGIEVHRALISRMPGLHGQGDVIAFASNATMGTLAAVQYLTGKEGAEDMQRRLRMPSGELPRYYEVVVEAKVRDWVPIEISSTLHRALEQGITAESRLDNSPR